MAPTFVSPPPDAHDFLDSNNEVMPRFCTLEDVLDNTSPTGLAPRNLDAELFVQVGEEPASFIEAKRHSSWWQVMLEEMESIKSNETWHPVPLQLATDPLDSSGFSR